MDEINELDELVNNSIKEFEENKNPFGITEDEIEELEKGD